MGTPGRSPAAPILGMTTSAEVARQLNLSWGVIPAVGMETEDTVELGNTVLNELSRLGLAKKGDRVVITAGLPLGFSDSTNVIRVLELE